MLFGRVGIWFKNVGEVISATIEVESPDFGTRMLEPALNCDTNNSGMGYEETTHAVLCGTIVFYLVNLAGKKEKTSC